jgi:hypothetical protein
MAMAAAAGNVKLTFRDLLTAANSNNPTQRRQAFEAFQAWVKMAPKLDSVDRLSASEQHVLHQIFRQKGVTK